MSIPQLFYPLLYKYLFKSLLSFVYILRSGISASYSNYKFNFFQELLYHFSQHVHLLHSHQQCIKFLISPYLCQHLTIFCLLDNSHCNGHKVVSHCVLICIYLMICDVEHFLMYLLALTNLLWKKCLFKIFAHIFCLFVFCWWWFFPWIFTRSVLKALKSHFITNYALLHKANG